MNSQILEAFKNEVSAYKANSAKGGNLEIAWYHLERAHILGQFSALLQLQVHFYMIIHALKAKDFAELLGQVPRFILAVPGSIFRLAPVGNPGGTSVGIFQPVEIPHDLKAILMKSDSN